MDKYTILHIKDDRGKYDISQLCGDLCWRDSVDTLGMELSFDFPRNYRDIEVGDKIVMNSNGNEVFRGIITDLKISKLKISITAFDYAFYLNKSKIIIQFTDISASQAIRQLCIKFSVPFGKIANMSTQINNIYKNKTIAKIIQDILIQAENELGTKYRLETRKGKLYIEEYNDLIISATFQPATNITPFNVLDAIGSITKSESIQDMRNSVQVASNNEESDSIVAEAKDEINIKKYGLLQEVISVDEKDESQANNIAQNILDEKNKINESVSLELLGNDNVRAGRILEIVNTEYKLIGKYMVTDCTHKYSNGIHKMSLTVKKVK